MYDGVLLAGEWQVCHLKIIKNTDQCTGEVKTNEAGRNGERWEEA